VAPIGTATSWFVDSASTGSWRIVVFQLGVEAIVVEVE